MLESQPLRSPGVRLGFLMIAGVLLADIIFLYFIITLPFTFLSFLLGFLLLLTLPLLIVIVLGTRAVRFGRYHVDADMLHLDLIQAKEHIPLSSIEGFLPGKQARLGAGFRGWRWPGLYLGKGSVEIDERKHEASFLATRPLAAQQLVLANNRVYGISPADPVVFQDSLKALMVGSLPTPPELAEPDWGILGWQIWRDRLFLSLNLAALGLNMLLFAYLSLVYRGLPAQVPLHFNLLGEVDRYGSPLNLLLLPMLAFLFGSIDAALGLAFYNVRDNGPVAYLLWCAGIVIQIVAWVALLGLINAI